ncbi:MAG TPA: tRNA (adenosine(37)-N6)-threonylcarbamoyltransferase complex dimerization subunit type 1 TsaB [Candidatus Acidoferrales bacterium]|nr:tRNA (adenosine(37)-N6)-threonylcarbamoyltransferase complex dimerization subunit type 1 TsaB [Candidatus Acidoferrales bacterium]
MRLLAIDTCLRAGGVAALQDGTLLKAVFSKTEEPYSSRLFRDLRTLAESTRLAIGDYDAYAVANGPGSFTGVRAGVTAAKAWSEVFGKPVVEISSLEAVAAQIVYSDATVKGLPALQSRELICAVLDAHRGQVFGGIYRSFNGGQIERLFEGALSPGDLIAEVLARAENSSVRFATPTADMLSAALVGSKLEGSAVITASEDLAPWVGRIAVERLKAGKSRDALTLDANYIRRCDAEVYWKGTA